MSGKMVDKEDHVLMQLRQQMEPRIIQHVTQTVRPCIQDKFCSGETPTSPEDIEHYMSMPQIHAIISVESIKMMNRM
jgi:hypothetical protein